jgi:hypothetical protein
MAKNEIGLWIDHRKAVIAFASGDGGEIKQIESDMEKHVRFSGGAADLTEEDMRDRRFTNQLNKYYDAVIACIRDADSILIFGPGEAKGELQKRLEELSLGGHIVGIETADKMTDRQVAAKVRQHFLKP